MSDKELVFSHSKLRPNPFEVEKRFNEIKILINNYVLKDGSEKPPEVLFEELDVEYKKIVDEYEKHDMLSNLYHVQHNYLWSRTYRVMPENPTLSLLTYLEAIGKIIERNQVKPYKDTAIDSMARTYSVTLSHLKELRKSIDFPQMDDQVIAFYKKNIEATKCIPPILKLLSDFATLVCESYYDKLATDGKYSESELLYSKVHEILNLFIKTGCTEPRMLSVHYQTLYIIRKKQLHHKLQYIYFEEEPENKEQARNEMGEIIQDMLDYAGKSLSASNRFIKALPEEHQQFDTSKLITTMKELDLLSAKYYYWAYDKNDILKAWHKMDEIKQYLVNKAFNENVQLSDTLLKYFSEEWMLLYVFAKICLLKEETERSISAMNQAWEIEVFNKIVANLQSIQELFKYEIKDDKDYRLKIVTSTFSGNFSEYFIHELLVNFSSNGSIDDGTPVKFKKLLTCAKVVSSDKIKLRHVIQKGKPDVDIYIENQCAIFLKNSKIESKEMKQMWTELETAVKNKNEYVIFGINFIKNVDKIEYIRDKFVKMKKENPSIELEIHDIKDLVSLLINELERFDALKLNFPLMDLCRVLDY